MMARRKATIEPTERAVAVRRIEPANGMYQSPVCDFARPQANLVIKHLRKVHGEAWRLADDSSIVEVVAVVPPVEPVEGPVDLGDEVNA